MTEQEQKRINKLNSIKRKSNARSVTILQKRKWFLEAFRLQACVISGACRCVHINRGTFYNWCKDSPEFAAEVRDARDDLLDIAESQVYKNVMAGKETSLIFLLCNKRPEDWKNIQRVDMHVASQAAAYAKKMSDILNTPAPEELKYYSPVQLKQLNKHIAQEIHRRDQGAPIASKDSKGDKK